MGIAGGLEVLDAFFQVVDVVDAGLDDCQIRSPGMLLNRE